MSRKQVGAFRLGEISGARPYLMGLATLWIALFHSYDLDFFQSDLLNRLHLLGIMNRLKETGNCGVDIFLFLSGLGLVYSWTGLRETAHPLRAFYRRRISRVLPPVLTVSIIYYGLIGTEGFADWAGKVFLYGFFSPTLDGGRYWYFALLMLLYLLFPLIWKAMDRWGTPGAAGLIALVILVPAGLQRAGMGTAWFDQTEIMWSRIPVFLAGAYFGRLCQRDARIPGWAAALTVPMTIGIWFGASMIPGEYMLLRRYAYGLLTICIVISHAWVLSKYSRKGIFRRGMAWLGGYSLEIYLIYENLYLYNPLGMHGPDAVGWVYAITVFMTALVLSMMLRMVLDALRGVWKKTERL